jgi:hypothetical protein
MFRAYFFESWFLLRTLFNGYRTARVEATASRRVERAGHIPF